MPSVTRTVIRLGNTTDDGIPTLDPDGVNSAENASALLGTSFTGATMSVESVTYSTTSNISFDGASGGNTVTYDNGAGPVAEFVDQAVWYNVSIVLADSSTMNTNALIFQTQSGETYLTEFSSRSLDNLDIASVTPTSVLNSFFASMATNSSVDGTTVCFGRGTQIMTPDGPRAVETFQPCELVSTTDGTPQAVVAVYRTRVDPDKEGEVYHIASSAFGPDMPSAPLWLTGNHRILCASKLVERMFGVPRILVPAKRFPDLKGVSQISEAGECEFFHLELRQHSVICANGALVESCLLGSMAIASLPAILGKPYRDVEPPKTRFPVPNGARQRAFVHRLIKNSRPLVEPDCSADDFASLAKAGPAPYFAA